MLESENRKLSLGAISLSALGLPATTYFELRHHGEAEVMWNPRFVVKQLTSVATSHRGEISFGHVGSKNSMERHRFVGIAAGYNVSKSAQSQYNRLWDSFTSLQ